MTLKNLFAFALISTFPVIAFAHDNMIEMTQLGIEATLAQFQKDDAEEVPNFLGVKGWPSGHKIQVRIYLKEKKELRYTCYEHEHDGKEMIMCDKLR